MDVTLEKLGFHQSLGALPADVPHLYKIAEVTCTGIVTLFDMELNFPCVVRMETLKPRERKAIEDLAQKGNKRKTAEQIIEFVLTRSNIGYKNFRVTKSMFEPFIGPGHKCYDTTYYVRPRFTAIEMDLRAAEALTFEGDNYAVNEEIGDFICYFVESVGLHRDMTYNPHCCDTDPDLLFDPDDFEEFDSRDAEKALEKKGIKPGKDDRFRFYTPKPPKVLSDD